MSRGRKKQIINSSSEWERIFVKNVGFYLQAIIIDLSSIDSNELNNSTETGEFLLSKVRSITKKTYSPIKLAEKTFKIPNDWVWCRLGEVGICKTGKTPPTAEKDNFGSDVPFIKPADITLSGINYENEALSYKGLEKGVLIPKDSLLMVCIGGSIGKSFYNSKEVSCNQQINTITPLAGINVIFLQYLLQTDYFQREIWRKAAGGTMPIVNRSKWESIVIPLAPLSIQDGILNFLNDLKSNNLKESGCYFNYEVENKIIHLHYSQITGIKLNSELTHQQSLLTQLRQAILQEAVQGKLVPQHPDDEPASVLLDCIRAEKAKLLQAGKLKKEKSLPPIRPEEVPFELPEGWVWCRLGEIADIVRGGSPRPAGDKRFYDGNIPFLKVGDLTGYEDIYLTTYTHTIKEAGLQKTRFVEADTLMLTNSGATLGIPRICTFPTTFNDGIAAFLNLNHVDKEFLYYFLKSKTSWFLKEASRGQGQPNLNTDIIALTMCPLPPLAEQRRIVARVQQLLGLCGQLEQQVQESRGYAGELLQAVLQEAFGRG